MAEISKRRILLVDDEIDLVRAVSFRLKAEGYEVITAPNGEEAFRKVESERPDLVILDLMIPKMNGYRVCSLIKADPRLKDTPVIIFTARAQEVDKRIGADVGADAYITKPFEPDDLFKKIRELLKV